MNASVKIAVVVGGFGLAYWLTLPPQELALDSACRLTDLQARLSEAIYGPSFWQAQKDAVDREMTLLRGVSATAGLSDDALKSPMSPTESRMTRLSNGSSAGTADEQSAAKTREQRAEFEQLGHLTTCRVAILKNL